MYDVFLCIKISIIHHETKLVLIIAIYWPRLRYDGKRIPRKCGCNGKSLIPPVDDNPAFGERRELLEEATNQFDLLNARSPLRRGQQCSRRALYLDALAVVGNVVLEAAVSSSGRGQFVRPGMNMDCECHGFRRLPYPSS